MQKLIICLFTFFFAITTWAQEQYILEGKISTLKEGSVELVIMEKDRITTEEVFVKNGTFTIKGSVKVPCVATLWINNTRERYSFYIENAKIFVQLSKINENEKKFTVEGSKTNEAYQEFIKECNEMPEPEQETCFKKLVLSNGKSIFSPFVIQSELIYTIEYPELKELLENLSGEAVNTFQYKQLHERMEALAKVSVGQPAPFFEQPDIIGKNISFKELLNENKYVLIDFWASWCRPCREENHTIVKAYEIFHNRGFDIFAVSLDDNKEKWLGAIKDDGLVWTQASNLKGWENEAAKLYCVNSIPSNVLIDQKGIIIARNLHGEELLKKLESLMGKEIPSIR